MIPLALIQRYWKLALLTVVLLALTIQTFRLSATQASLSAEKAGRALDRASYERAQAEATSIALSNKLKVEAENARKFEQADARTADLSAQYRAAVLRYQAAQRQASSSNLPGPTEAAQGSDGPGVSAVISLGQILIPTDDALICAENTARLQAAHEWAISLEPTP